MNIIKHNKLKNDKELSFKKECKKIKIETPNIKKLYNI